MDLLAEIAPAQPAAAVPYRVLARKYRPARLADLIGQTALVRTLTNALRTGRVAHAFMLTGVRGVGKTTTARIIARALNCTGRDARTGPSVEPCGTCENCTAIAQDRHVDVLEMDAASRTGVDDIREIVDSVRYGPVQGRFKIYIIDEVHMLTRNAFNALLKTLEEPPPHAKFVFATTEIRKVPITVLSRCQRFDLRRVEGATLIDHYARICAAEQVTVEPEALALIARAADGSVRDGLSLLDQAIARAGEEGVTEADVRDMLGLADRTLVLDLYEAAMAGRAAEALDQLARLHAAGADPATVLGDLLDVTHTLTRLKTVPKAAADMPEAERVRGMALAERLSVPVLARTWQLLLKGVSELQVAPDPGQAAEMVVLRLIHAADLPSPADLIRRAQAAGLAAPRGEGGRAAPGSLGGGPSAATSAAQGTPRPADGSASAPGSQAVQAGGAVGAPPRSTRGALALATASAGQTAPSATSEAAAQPDVPVDLAPLPRDFAAAVALVRARREVVLAAQLSSYAHLVRFEEGLIELRPAPNAPRDMAAQLGSLLTAWTGRRWTVALAREGGGPTLSELERAARDAATARAEEHPLVRSLLQVFPGARITALRVAERDATAALDDEPGAGEPLAPPPPEPDDDVPDESF